MDENEDILTEFNFEDWEEPLEPKAYEQVQRPPFAKLILDTVQDAPSALQDWAELVVPKLLSVLALRNAKGMGEVEANRFLGKTDFKSGQARAKAFKKLTEMPDQSLAVHTLNAALGGWTVVALANLDDFEQRLYLAGITLHDLNKMLGTTLRLQGEQKEAFEEAFKAWAERLGLWQFIGENHWADVAYLAQNAEAVKGENRTLFNYDQLQTSPEDLEPISDFVRLADLLASAAKHPDDVLNMGGGNKVIETLRRVLRGKYILRYHKTADNRGLLTQLIHNAVLEQAQEKGWLPFLYFPDGVTYLVPKEAENINLEDVPQRVRQMLVESVADKLGQLVARAPTGMRYKPEFIELLTPARACKLAIQRILEIISDKKPPVTDERKAKTVLRKDATVKLDFDYGASLNADRLAEGLFGVSKIIFDYYGDDRETHGGSLICALGLGDLVETFRSIEFTGGVGYPWYYIGGHYIHRNPGLDANDVENVMQKAVTQVLGDLGEPKKEPPFGFLESYIGQTLSTGTEREAWNFSGELERYVVSKKLRSGQRVCAVCNSSFAVRADYSTFSNKQVAGYADARRGICQICQAENLLRRFTLGKDMLSDDGTKFLHLYPTYFFTPITAKVMQHAYQSFKQATFAEIAKPYQQADYEVRAILHADVFQVLKADNPKRRLDRVDYPEGQMHGYFLLGVPYLGRDPSDTETWVMPALLALLSPLLFGTKAVVSDSALPLFTSGADFPETVVLDAPHSFWQHGIKKTRFRLDELEKGLHTVLALYGLVSEAYKDGKGYAIWNQLGSVARNLDSEPLSIFGYADRISSQLSKGKSTLTSTDGMSPWLAQRLTTYYESTLDFYETYSLGGTSRMGLIQETVDKYAKFYRARGSSSAYARLRPLDDAIKVILAAPTEEQLDQESLHLEIMGALMAYLGRIRDRDPSIKGIIPKGMWSDDVLLPAVSDFATHMLDKVFCDFAGGDRAILRKQLNKFKNGCEAYYVLHYGRKKTDESASTENHEKESS